MPIPLPAHLLERISLYDLAKLPAGQLVVLKASSGSPHGVALTFKYAEAPNAVGALLLNSWSDFAPVDTVREDQMSDTTLLVLKHESLRVEVILDAESSPRSPDWSADAGGHVASVRGGMAIIANSSAARRPIAINLSTFMRTSFDANDPQFTHWSAWLRIDGHEPIKLASFGADHQATMLLRRKA